MLNKLKFTTEPALWIGLIQALLALAVGFGLDLSEQEVALILAAVSAIAALIVRQEVTPVAKIDAV